jgi:endoglucanase
VCLQAAKNGWQYLVAHPTIVPAGGFTNPPGVGTGAYGDGNDADERLWAAAELFETTGETAYNSYVITSYKSGTLFGTEMWWQDLRPLALLTYLRSKQPTASSSVKSSLSQALRSYCVSQVGRRNSSGYHTILLTSDYYWGSNSNALNVGILLIAGAEQFADSTFVHVAADQLHYVLGANALSRSFLTGIGENPPRQPHHRPSGSDGIADPVPGLLVGGPDRLREDPVLQALYSSSTPPALCYADSTPSYASNEVAVNWNAPLVFLAGYFGGEPAALGVHSDVRSEPEQYDLEQNYPNPFNGTTAIGIRLPAGRQGVRMSELSEVKLQVFDLLGRLQTTLVEGRRGPGTYRVQFDAGGLASGTYVYRLTAGEFAQSKKMVLIR